MGLRYIDISSSETYIDVLEKTAQVFQRPNQCIQLGYEAPWSTKIGSKKSLAYISNDKDLAELWTEYGGYLKEQAKKKAGDEKSSGIMFRNMHYW